MKIEIDKTVRVTLKLDEEEAGKLSNVLGCLQDSYVWNALEKTYKLTREESEEHTGFCAELFNKLNEGID